MKCKTVKHEFQRVQWILLALFTLCFVSCKDDNDQQVAPYDPGKPVEITDFTPDTGGGNTRVVVYGKNFGTDVSLLKLTVGGKEAKIINVLGEYMYCMIPQKAIKGNLVLTVGEGEQAQTVEAEKKFKYVRQMVVSTLCGKTNDKNEYDVKPGPFDDCGGIAEPTWFSFDPNNNDILYLAQDNSKKIRVLDLKNKYIYMGLVNGNGLERMRTITWTNDGDTMIVANDRGGDTDVSNYYIVRDKKKPVYEAFNENPKPLTQSSGCNGSVVHPNGELYYNSFGQGIVYKYDYWNAHKPEGGFDFTKPEKLFTIQDTSWEFNMVIHPSGKYAYIVVINRHYIMRTDYDNVKRRFGTPYLFCGKVKEDGWEDAIGDKARLSSPYQGVFVKNQQYVDEHREDEYDFYFADRDNHCIRCLTPDGSVTTFAGRGSTGNSSAEGLTNGGLRTEARFRQPCALAYDDKNAIFYVGDWGNHCIRKIAMEEADDEQRENN